MNTFKLFPPILYLLFLLVSSHTLSYAQTDLAAGTDWQQLDYNGSYQDYKIPDNFTGVLHLGVYGADGGFAKPQLSGCQVGGGSGAFVLQELSVGNGVNQIPPGSTVRFIIGQSGQSHSTNGGLTSGSRSGAGGGGTAVVAKINDEWVILSVAGGGGGAYARLTAGVCEAESFGRSGNLNSNGDGSSGRGSDAAAGGSGGGGGGTTNDPDQENDEVGGGGGAFEDGDGSAQFGGYFSGGYAGWSNGPNSGTPTGGEGGDQNYDSNKNGGFGFGGGGAANHSGGGGGGYSGGGSGENGGSGGGGGGSYIVPNYTDSYSISADDPSFENKNGKVLYRLEWRCFIEIASVTVDEAESCASAGATITTTLGPTLPCATDLYYDLKDATNPDDLQFLTSNADGVFENVGVGEFAIVVGNVAYGPMDTATFVVNTSGDVAYPIAKCRDITVTLDETGTYLMQPEEVDGGSTDDCGIHSFLLLDGSEIGKSELLLNCEQVNDPDFTVGLAVRDHASRTSICSAKVTVLAPPSLPDELPLTVYLNESGKYNLKEEDVSHFEVTDICGGADDNITYTIDFVATRYTCADVGQSITDILEVSDAAGNTAVGEMLITVLDTIRPTITCQDVTIELDARGAGHIDYLDFIVSANDNCLTEAEIISGYSWDSNLLPTTIDCDDIGTHEVNLLRSPVAHETDLPPCSATLTIIDQIAPTIICEDITVELDDQGYTNISDEELPITYSDNCTAQEDITINRLDNTFTCFHIGDDDLQLEVTAIDQFNNSSSCSFKVTVVDPTTPIVQCKDRRMLMRWAGPSLNITELDVLDGIGSACTASALGSLAFAPGTPTTYFCEDIEQDNFVTLIFTPDNGDPISSCTARITPYEESAPTFNCPGSITGGVRRVQVDEQAGLCGAVYNFDLSPTDNCGITSVIQDQGLPSGATFPYGETRNSITVSDASGNSNNCTFIVEVRTTTAPSVDCPDDLNINLESGSCGVILDPFPVPTILDDCNGITMSQIDGPLPSEELSAGTHKIEYKISKNGTNTYCSINVTINDKIAPVAKCTAVVNTYTFNNSNLLRPNVSWVDDGSYDPCDGTINRKVFPTALKCHQMGQQVLTMVLYDAQGNRSECQSTVMILPAPPVCQDISVQLDASGEASIISDDLFAGTDNACGTNLTLSQSDFTCSNIGTNEVVLTLTTDAGFTSSCTSTVTVTDDALSPTCQQSVLLHAKILLEGPYDVASGLMNDALRTQNLIPSNSPYIGTTETINSNVLTTTGNNAIVDWVLVQVRSEFDNTEVLYQRAALLQRDGDVVDVDVSSPVSFDEASEGNYYVVVKHRNHLGCMTASPIALSSTTTTVDFMAASQIVYGGASRTELAIGKWGCYAADADGSGAVNASDRSMTWNDRNRSGYLNTDCNLDGSTNATDRSSAWNNRNVGGTVPE